MAVGIFLRIYHIDARSFLGDELCTLPEAQNLGANFQSLPYFAMLHYWMKLGTSEAWIRLFSALWGILWIPAVYAVGRAVSNSKTGFIAALLAATSPLGIYYSHLARFYTFFLLVSTISIAVYLNYIKSKSKPLLGWLTAVNVLLIFSHFFGFVVPVFEVIIYFIFVYEKGNKKAKAFSTIAISAIVLSALLVPDVRAWGWAFIQKYAHSIGTTEFTQSRGINLYNLAKIPFAFYFLTLNDYVYPLNLTIVIPCLLGFGAAFLIGLKNLAKTPVISVFFNLLIWGGLFFVLVLADALAPGGNGTSVRYVIFLLPVLYVITALGISKMRIWGILTAALVFINGMAINQEWSGKWSSFEGAHVDWRTVAKELQVLSKDDARILYDGRSDQYMEIYLKDRSKCMSNWNYSGEAAERSRLIWVSNDWQEENRLYFNATLNDIQKTHFYKSAKVIYPFFMYVFEKNPRITQGYYEAPLPLEIYSLELKDMRFPIQKKFEGLDFEVHGTFALNVKRNYKTLFLPGLDRKPKRLLILSSLLRDPGVPESSEVARIIIKDADNNRQDLVLKMGTHTDNWDQLRSEAKTFMTWHKSAAILGWQKYEGSMREFDAHIFAAEFRDLTIDAPTDISIVYKAPKGRLHIWGVYLI